MIRAPLRPLRRSFWTTSLWICGQYHIALHAPAVDNVADKIECFRVVMTKKIEKHLRLTSACAEVNIGEKDRPEMPRGRFDGHDALLTRLQEAFCSIPVSEI
jgi:hypothetical protein